MCTVSPLTTYQKFEKAWNAYNAETAPEIKIQKFLAMIAILKEEILGFRSSDAVSLRRLVLEISQEFDKDSKLVKKITKLADRLAK